MGRVSDRVFINGFNFTSTKKKSQNISMEQKIFYDRPQVVKKSGDECLSISFYLELTKKIEPDTVVK